MGLSFTMRIIASFYISDGCTFYTDALSIDALMYGEIYIDTKGNIPKIYERNNRYNMQPI